MTVGLNLLIVKRFKPTTPKAHSIIKDFIPRLFLSVSTENSMAVNNITKGALIIAGSGMFTGGLIRHHFK
jgi:metallo-beta-lactamase family protein